MTEPNQTGPPALTDRARRLAGDSGIYLGTSSWRYDGWRGLVYNDHYPSKKAFHQRCLEEYARHFPAVGVDATFYKFPDAPFIDELVARTPDRFRFGLKATEEITVLKWPTHKRYGNRAGQDNPYFLDSDRFAERFLEPVRALGAKLGPVMLQFGTLPKRLVDSGDFLERLDAFLGALPGGFQIATEIRNRDLFGETYFDILRSHNVAHVHTSWSWMPPLAEQLARPGSFTADFFAMRLLTPPQVAYQQAVETYFPYRAILKPQEEVRQALVDFLQKALGSVQKGYVFVNNRLEGSSPLTIEYILDQILEDQ